MARHLKSANSGSPANFVSGRHANTTAGQARLIRLTRAANDNQAPHRRWLTWLSITAAIAALLVLVSMV